MAETKLPTIKVVIMCVPVVFELSDEICEEFLEANSKHFSSKGLSALASTETGKKRRENVNSD